MESNHPTIIIIRHGEKIEWEDGNSPSKEAKKSWIDTKVLSTKGYERANALVGYFLYRKEMKELPPINAIFTQIPNKSNKKKQSKRPLQTIEPLAQVLNIKISGYENHQYLEMISEILSMPKYRGKSVLISWEHKGISDLLKAIGAPAEQIIKHPKKSFDITYVVSISKDSNNGKKVNVKRLPQKLLFGDCETI